MLAPKLSEQTLFAEQSVRTGIATPKVELGKEGTQ
jgi:hypothetical protein